VLHARSGEEALAAVGESGGAIDLVLMDINLGAGMDGTRAAELILMGHELPVLFMSSHTEKAIVEKTERITNYGYVVKNSSITVLNASIKMALKLFESRAELWKAQSVAHLGSWEWHLDSDRLEWSDEMYRIFGLDKSTFTGRLADVIASAIHPGDREAVEASNAAVLEQARPVPLEYRIVKPDGQVRTVWAEAGELRRDVEGGPSVLSGIVLDITDRVSARERLEESLDRLQVLTEHISDVIWVLNIQKRAFTYISPSVVTLRGYTVEEALAQDLLASLSPESARKVLRDIPLRTEAFLKEPGRRIDYLDQLQQTRKYGPPVWIETSTHYRLNREGEVEVIGVSRDMTERKKAENLLHEGNMRLTAMLDAIPDLVFRLDDRGVVLDYKADIADLYLRSGDIVGANLHDMMPADFSRTIDLRTAEALRTGELQTFEYDLVLPERGKRHYEARMARSGTREVTAIIRDITDQDRMREELQDSRESVQSYFNMGTIGMCVTSPGKGWLEINDRLCEMLGYGKAELKGMTWAQLTHPEDLGLDLALFDAVMRDERDSYQLDKRFIRKDGGVVSTSLYVTCQRNEDRSVRHFFASLVDITERRQAELALRKSLEDKGVLMRELQHRAKNSLNLISSLIELSLPESPSPEARSTLEELNGRVRSVAELYTLLHDTGSFERVALDDYLTRIAMPLLGLSPQVELRAELGRMDIPAGLAAPIGLIVTELVTNALKYAFPDSAGGTIRLALRSTARGAVLEFEDDGVGLPTGFTLSSGSGLGLKLVSALSRQIGGSFSISGGGGGTKCRICWPTAPGQVRTG